MTQRADQADLILEEGEGVLAADAFGVFSWSTSATGLTDWRATFRVPVGTDIPRGNVLVRPRHGSEAIGLIENAHISSSVGREPSMTLEVVGNGSRPPHLP